MQTSQKNKKIFFIGRLEYEKWADILLQIVIASESQKLPYEFHIFGEWSFLEKFSQNNVFLHGKVAHHTIFSELRTADYLLMPSRFLETFWLVALESLSCGVPVIGFQKWGLASFISDDLALNEKNPVESFLQIMAKSPKTLVNISDFSVEKWRNNLEFLMKDFSRILIVHDYKEKIWGAEIYVQHVQKELQKMGKMVEFFWYSWEISPKIRKKLFFASLFSKKREKELSEKIAEFQPDVIWSHSILRYIGAGGARAITEAGVPHFLMHHDLGLFSPFPSKIFSWENIPKNQNLWSWIFPEKTLFGKILATIKWLLVRRIVRFLPKNTVHLVPSSFMVELCYQHFSKNVIVFSHTIFK